MECGGLAAAFQPVAMPEDYRDAKLFPFEFHDQCQPAVSTNGTPTRENTANGV